MSDAEPNKIFEKYASEGHRMFKDFSMTESQEMMLRELLR